MVSVSSIVSPIEKADNRENGVTQTPKPVRSLTESSDKIRTNPWSHSSPKPYQPPTSPSFLLAPTPAPQRLNTSRPSPLPPAPRHGSTKTTGYAPHPKRTYTTTPAITHTVRATLRWGPVLWKRSVKPTMRGKRLLAVRRSFGVRMMSGAWNVMRWGKLRAIAKVARWRWMMGICFNLRGFVTGISIRWVCLEGGDFDFSDFCFGSLVALREKLGLEVSKIRVCTFLKMRGGQEDDPIHLLLSSTSSLSHIRGWLVETRYLFL